MTEPRAPVTREPARPIRWRGIWLLESANGLSGVGNAIVMITIPWLVLQSTGSVAAAGLVAAISSVPGALASPLAGWGVDRLGRRLVSVASDIASALSVVAFPLAAWAFGLSLPLIITFAVVGAVFDPAGYTARKALIADVSREANFDTDRLNGIHEGIFAIGWTLGPLVAAVLIASIGAINAFWVPFALFIVSAVLIAVLRVRDAGQEARRASEASESSDAGMWHQAVLGVRIIWRDRPLRALTIAILVLAAVYMPTEAVILPAYFENLDLPWGLGVVIAALAGGSVIGAFGYGWLARRMRRLTLARLVLAGTVVAIIPLSLLPPIPVMVLAAFLLGLAWGPMNPLLTTIVQRRVPPDAQGRVFGVQLSIFYAAPPVAMLLTGVAVESFGLQATYLALAGLMVVTAVVVFFIRSIHAIDD